MNRRLAALLVALSIIVVVGAVLVVDRLNARDTAEETPRSAPTTAPTPASPGEPDGTDGEALEVGNIVLGGIEPVKVGEPVAEYVRQGYLVADKNPPCEGHHWSWASQFSEGLYVSATQDGIIAALGTDKDGLETADGIGVGSSLRDLKADYGEFLAQVRPDDQGVGWTSVKEGNGWFAFSLGPADQVTHASRVDFVEVGTGDVLHHFNDAC